ncbi:MBL fold metallo-hydrolase [Chengkuizengella axinellae]|uniref:MBL fold metallo-hydrolase n=1 Tax=Chengkuizengella axinellae TaxID=3064388 RepID=A0ABT9IXV2_9BACL|nr:MBL fold metallo-hydrolase [Chengkuizengella sp. 2205SS18-9]MDP5274143.1 MBL fold metallo-hydrolase [Chengkuizengella sp. 2205SS18-9]
MSYKQRFTKIIIFTCILTLALSSQVGNVMGYEHHTETERNEMTNQESDSNEREETSAVAPLPENAKGPVIPMDKGYVVEEIGDGVYAVMDGIFTTMFLTTGKGVIAVDAPQSMGEKYLNAIKEVTDEPVKYLIYSHAHKDHIGAASMFPDDVEIIAHEETKKILEKRQDPNRPIPTKTFKGSNMKLKVGNKKLQLDYMGDNHQRGNIFIYVPDEKVLMAVDIIFPGWVPFRYLALSEDIPGWIEAHSKIMDYDFNTLVAGHVTRLGTREDVKTQINYVNDIKRNAEHALQTTDLNAIGQSVGFENPWLLMDVYYDELIKVCNDATVPNWIDKLGGADVLTDTNCSKMIDSLRLD